MAAGPSFRITDQAMPSHGYSENIAHSDYARLVTRSLAGITEEGRLEKLQAISMCTSSLEVISQAYSPTVAHALFAYMHMALGQYDAACDYFDMADVPFHEDAYILMSMDAFNGEGLFRGEAVEERYGFLCRMIRKGGEIAENAQRWLNISADEARLIFTETSSEPDEALTQLRKGYLRRIVERGTFGADHAQELLSQVAYEGWLGFPLDGDFEYLESVVTRGPFAQEYTQRLMNQAAAEGRLGFNPGGEGYLEGIVERRTFGADHAQKLINGEDDTESSSEGEDAPSWLTLFYQTIAELGQGL